MKFSKQAVVTPLTTYNQTHLVKINDPHGQHLVKYFSEQKPTTDDIARWHYEYQIIKSYQKDCMLVPNRLINTHSELAVYFEYFPGVTLRSLIETNELPRSQQMSVAILLTRALNQLHQQSILHRNINVDNVLIDLEQKQLKFSDLTLVTAHSSSQVGKSPLLYWHCLDYLAPELTGRTRLHVDHRTDIYMLGCVLYHLFSGQKPFPIEEKNALVHAHITQKPAPLSVLNPELKSLSAVLDKMMEKSPDDRYQSLFGVLHDLEQIAAGKELASIATKDFSAKLIWPHKLYGRDQELSQLKQLLSLSNNGNQLAMVSGYSGIGKTVLIDELQNPILAQGGFLLKAKCEQFGGGKPYGVFAEALQPLLSYIRSLNSAEQMQWQDMFEQALKENISLISELVPEFAEIFTQQPPLPPLPVSEQETRFKNTMATFLRVVSKKLTKLVLFLDDLQWADTSTIGLIEHMFQAGNDANILLLGAYRSNEVSAAHPLSVALKRIEQSQEQITQIELNNLTESDVSELLQDVLHNNKQAVAGLVELILTKTKGNPFFVHQFINSLADENILFFEESLGCWSWDIKEIIDQDITDNVVELMVQQLQKLPDITQHLLTYAAHLGSQFDLNVLSVINKSDSSYVVSHLKQAIETGLILPLTDDFQYRHSPELLLKATFRFSHDRVQQAAYSLTPSSKLQTLQLHVGTCLLAYCEQRESFDGYLFTLLEQLNPAKSLLAPALYERLLTLNLMAAEQAKQSSAFKVALDYLQVAESLLPDNSWQQQPEQALSVYRELAEVSYLAGQYEQTEQLCLQHIELANDAQAKVVLSMALIQLLQTQMRFPEAITTAQNALELLGLRLPDDEETAYQALVKEFEQMESAISDVSAQQVLDLPQITDADVLQLFALYESTLNPYYLSGRQFTYCLVATRMTALTLAHGQCDITSVAIRSYMMTRARMKRPYKECYDVGKLACQLADKHDNRFYSCAVYQVYCAGYQTWVEPMQQSFAPLRMCVDWGFEGINPVYAGYAALLLGCNLMVKGLPLSEVAQEVERGQALFTHTHQPMGAMYLSVAVENPMLALMGKTDDPLTCDTASFSITDTFKGDYATPSMELALHSHAMLRNAFLFDSLELQQRFVPLLPLVEAFMPDSTLIIDGNFYTGLILLSWLRSKPEQQTEWLPQIESILAKFELWQGDSVENFEHKLLLLKAEYAALQGQHMDAQALYSQAILSAQNANYLSCEAVANELYANYWRQQNQPQAAECFVQQAHACYRQWQAEAKVTQLESRWTHVTFTTETNKQTDALDLETMLAVNQIISSEIQLDSLLDKLILIAIQNSGADRACLLTKNDQQTFVRAVGDIDNRTIYEDVTLDNPLARTLMPITAVTKVENSGELLLVDKPTEQYDFINDGYFKHQTPLTIACVPIRYQGQLFGFLYLENYATANAFNTAQINLLKSIAVQAAVSLSNALVYKTLEERVEQRTQDLVIAKQKAEDATVAKSNFLANMSHEIRTPMNAIIGLSRLAMRSQLNKEQKDYLTNILSSSESLLGLINDILDFSKIEAGKMKLEETQFELAKVIEQGIGVCNLKAHEKGIELITYVAPDIPNLLYGDPLRLQQVITNLAANAIKFTEQGTVTLEVAMRRVESQLELTFDVKDSGIGIGEEQQQRLFQSFSQADESVTRKYGGTGLGLAICKELVEMMGGQISVQSRLGHGSTFTFTARLQQAEALTSETVKPLKTAISDLNVLVVDDVELSRKSIVDTLHSSGVNAQAVNDGQQAINAVKASINSGHLYDLILMDWKMPNVDGIEASRFIRQELQQQSPNILMVSAYDKDEVKKQALDVAINGFIEKPVNQSLLLDHIMELISGKVDHGADMAHIQAPNLLNFKLLLVEDNTINQQVTLGFLADTHVQVDVASNGQVAVDMARDNHYDLILMDIQMPVMDGLTATQYLRNELKLQQPIIAMTAHAMEGDAQKSLAHGMNAHLVKPIDPDALFTTLASYLLPTAQNNLVDNHFSNDGQNADSALAHTALVNESPIDSQQLQLPDGLLAMQKNQLLDVENAIAKLKGKVSLYQDLVRDFVKANRNIQDKVSRAITTDETQGVYRIIHSLKSSAAYIGARQLLQQTTELEQCLANQQSSESLLKQVIETTEVLVAGIDEYLSVQDNSSNIERLSPAQMLNLLGEVATAAGASNVEAESLAEELYLGCVGTDYEITTKAIYDDINDFEYELALQAIQVMIASLQR